MLRYSFQENAAAQAIEDAVASAIFSGVRTADIASKGEMAVGTAGMGDAVLKALAG
jgi:3-isopropylmalate dehydrogenase